MKKLIFRNIAILSAIFIVTLSIMLVTNYFQIKDVTPLQTEVVESLKQLNDSGVDVPGLQDQIRQLDLLARKAYFVRMDHGLFRADGPLGGGPLYPAGHVSGLYLELTLLF